MKRLRLFSAMAFLGALGYAMTLQAAEGNPLTADQWKYRPVVVVAPTADDTILKQLDTAMNQAVVRDSFAERDMVLYTVVAGEGRRNNEPLTRVQTDQVLSAVNVNDTSRSQLFLLGLDGGVKLTQNDRADLEALFPVIDAMPMRRNR